MATALTSELTRFTDKCNNVLAGGIVKTFEPNSLTPKTTYQNPECTIPNFPEVVLDETGRAKIYIQGDYRIQVYSRDGLLIEDNLLVEQSLVQRDFVELSQGIQEQLTNELQVFEVEKEEAIQDLLKHGGRAYPTLALANADIANIALNTKVSVLSETEGGDYYKATAGATSLTKSAYDPVEISKQETIQNLLFDPFSETVKPDKSDALQCTRPAVFTSIVENSAKSPFGKRTLLGDNTTGVRRYIDAKKLSLANYQTFKVRVLADYELGDSNSRLVVYLRKSDNTVIDSNSLTIIAGQNDCLSKNFVLTPDTDHILIDVSGIGNKELVAISIATTVLPKFQSGSLPANVSSKLYEIDKLNTEVSGLLQNLAPDPFFRAYAEGLKTIDGFNCFDEATSTWSLVDYANSPFSNKKAMFFNAPAAAKNKKINFARFGLKVGDTLTARVGITSPTNGNIQIALYVYDSSGNIVGGIDATTTVLTANTYTECLRTITLTQAQVSSGVYARLRINVGNTTFPSGLYVCGIALYKNNTTETIKDTNQIEDSLRTQINSALAVPEIAPYTLNDFALRQFRQRSRKLLSDEVSKLVIADLGDSWTYGRTRYVEPMMSYLKNLLGDGGAGWFGFGYHSATPSAQNGNASADFSYTRTGVWSSIYAVNNTPRSPSPDSCHITSSEIGAKLTCVIPVALDGCDLFYIGSSNGVIRYRFNVGSWVTLNLNAVTDAALGVTALTGFLGTSNTLEIEVVSGTVSLCGCNYKSNANGVVVHKLGATGSLAHDWARLPEADWKNALSALNPNLVTMLLGINDQFVSTQDPVTFGNNIKTIIDRVKSALPKADVLVMMPPESNRANNEFLMKDYAYQAYLAAKSRNVAFLDFQKAFGDNVNDYIDWLAADGYHPSSEGNYVLTDALLRFLLG